MSNFKIGDKVISSQISTTPTITATILIIPKRKESRLILLGWEQGLVPVGAWPIKDDSPIDMFGPSDVLPNWKSFYRAFWIDEPSITLVAPHSMISKISTPVQCSKCLDKDFPYAEPNQPDGGFICWSCSNYPFYR